MIKIIILLAFAILLADARRHQLDIRVSCSRLSRKTKSMNENMFYSTFFFSTNKTHPE